MNIMDKITNGILWGFKKKEFPKEKVHFLPITGFKPTPEENKRLNFYSKLMGYHFKWSHNLKCPVIYSNKWKRHCMIQKDGSIMYVVYGNRKEYLDHITNASLTIINKYGEKKRVINNSLTTVKTGLTRSTLNNLFGINILNVKS